VVLAVAAALALLSIQQGSLRRGAVAIAPTALAVVWVSGGMGWLSIPIGVATSTFCAIVFGIGVDYAIHFLARLRLAPDALPRERALRAVREAGPAIAGDACAVAAGFGVLGLSQVPANARLGLLVSASLAASALLTLVGLAAFAIWTGARPSTGSQDPAGDLRQR
jgi:predicted RND superfamily exporter protein